MPFVSSDVAQHSAPSGALQGQAQGTSPIVDCNDSSLLVNTTRRMHGDSLLCWLLGCMLQPVSEGGWERVTKLYCVHARNAFLEGFTGLQPDLPMSRKLYSVLLYAFAAPVGDTRANRAAVSKAQPIPKAGTDAKSRTRPSSKHSALSQHLCSQCPHDKAVGGPDASLKPLWRLRSSLTYCDRPNASAVLRCRHVSA